MSDLLFATLGRENPPHTIMGGMIMEKNYMVVVYQARENTEQYLKMRCYHVLAESIRALRDSLRELYKGKPVQFDIWRM